MKEQNKQRNKKCLFTVLLLCGIITGVLIGFLIAVCLLRPGGGIGNNAEYTIESEADTVLRLGSNIWDELTDKERIDVLETVVNIERCRLGLSFCPLLTTGDLEENTTACYDHDRHTVTLDAESLRTRNAAETLESVCHEMYHAYQYELLDLYHSTGGKYRPLMIFDDVREYESEFHDYFGKETDGDDYYYQTCEITARDYAENERRRYYRFIALYKADGEEDITE